MTHRAEPPFRADHVGSLLRPPRLLQARERHALGEIGAEQLRAAEDDAVREVVRMQQDVGLLSATDGEFRRTTCCAVSTRPPGTFRWSSSACPRSAASPRRSRATPSPTTSRWPSSA